MKYLLKLRPFYHILLFMNSGNGSDAPDSRQTDAGYRGICGALPFVEIVQRMLNIVLVEPEIPMNTGNIARTCAATGSRLHLVEPLGFDISDSRVKRAGLDYWHLVEISVYSSLDDFFDRNSGEFWLLTTKARKIYSQAEFTDGCYLMFGKETAGLPASLLGRYPDRMIRLPMVGGARSLNLGNAVAAVAFEALRQMDFPGLA